MNLSETTLLLTRPRASALRFAAELERQAGAFGQTVISPLLEIVGLETEMEDGPDTVFVFTSEQGAIAAAKLSPPGGRLAYCVGTRTAQGAIALGYEARSASGDVDALAEKVRAEVGDRRLLHASGRHVTGDLVAKLRQLGHQIAQRVVYDQVAVPLSPEAHATLAGSRPVIVPLFSPRSAALFAEAATGATAPVHLAVISQAAAEPLANFDARSLTIATEPNGAGMGAAVIRLLASTGNA